MDVALANALRLLQLGLPAGLGAVAGATGVFATPRAAVAALNRYALTVGFPALVVRGLLADGELPTSPAFWLLWPVALAALLLGVGATAPRGQAGTLALVAAFGNIAYLGLPVVIALQGSAIAGAATLAVVIHVTLAVTVGPFFLERWGRDGAVPLGPLLRRLLAMPLFWAPAVGLLGRLAPAGYRAQALPWIDPLANSAAPVALFVLGLHVWGERHLLARVDGPLLAHLALRQIAAPAVVFGLAAGAVRLGFLDPSLGAVHVVLASTPVAITTFALADRAGVGQTRVAAAVVWSTVLAVLALPLWSSLAAAL